MNKRIEPLFKQAGGYVEIDNKGNYFTYTQDFDPEKFAQLLIQECTTVIEQNLFQGIGWNTSRAVKRHFGIGVEE
jgi:hypothetical protein